MAFINLTPHPITVYKESQFVNLEQLNTTTWVADDVDGEPVATFESNGSLRISTETKFLEMVGDIAIMETKYGSITGVPENFDETMIVSLPTLSMAKQSQHPLADNMVSPYQVVRLREKTSTVLGCVGFTH